MRRSTAQLLLALLLLLGGCSHAPPQLVQVFSQVNQVFDFPSARWTQRLSVFVQASSADGNRVFDRLHLIHDEQDLYITLNRDQWTVVERPGEYWVGTNSLTFPGKIPTGEWRALLVTRAGLKVESWFSIPAPPPDAPSARTLPVVVVSDGVANERYRVSGWVDNYLVWSWDAQGVLLGRAKTTGPVFAVPQGAVTFRLYSYDKGRGEGLEAGPFPVKGKD